MDRRDNVREWREGLFHFLISEAACVLLSGLGGQACDSDSHFFAGDAVSRCLPGSDLLAERAQ